MILPLLAGVAAAHTTGLSYARLADGALTLTFAEEELAAHIPVDDLDAARILLREITLDRVRLTAGDAACVIGDAALRRVEADGIAITASIDCPRADTWMYHAGFLPEMTAGHRHYVEADGVAVAVLDAAAPETALRGASDPATVARRFLALGVEHIWTGYDHLLFLLGLLLVTGRARDMLLVVTGFTVAHSLTLSAAALGWIAVPGWIVEPAIAASIAYVGLENLWRPAPRRRLAVTFGLGLVHGFGFAGMLAELGLPRDALALALVCFNGGVELGQAAVAALALPALLWLRRFPSWEARAVPAASIGVAAMGAYWFVERVAAMW